MSAPTFRPENALEETLLRTYETGDFELLLRTLAIADVYLPAEDGPDKEERLTAHEGDEFPVPVLESDDGTRLVPVFSSLAQLARIRPGGGYRRLTGHALASIMPTELGLALNPGGQLGLPIPSEQVSRITTLPPPDGGESEFLLGEPREEPTRLLETIGRFAEGRSDIRAAYRALLVRRPGAEPEHLIGLELDADAAAKDVVDAAADAARGAGLDHLGFVPLQPGVEAGQIARFMLTRTKPFWSNAT